MPLKLTRQPGMFTQATPPKPSVVGALLAPEIVAGKALYVPWARVTGAIVTLTALAAVLTVKLCETEVAAA